jgi:hypothetical protein
MDPHHFRKPDPHPGFASKSKAGSGSASKSKVSGPYPHFSEKQNPDPMIRHNGFSTNFFLARHNFFLAKFNHRR